MPDTVVITGVGICSALGETAGQTLAGLRSPHSALRCQKLHPELSLWFGMVPGTPTLCERSEDYTGVFAARTVERVLADSQFIGSASPDRVAMVMGCSKGRLHGLVSCASVLNPAHFPGETVGCEIAERYGFMGPVLNYPAACATGLACVIAGANLLRDDIADAVVAGSAEASGYALTMASFANMGALSRNRMRPFHRERDGFNPGEGAATFLLERESFARARGASPLARIAGYDLRADACHMTSAELSGNTIALSMQRAIRQAGWVPSDVEYINAHGTGTQLNDAIEARAIQSVFGEMCPPVSSLKSHVGHLLGASASVELGLSLIALKNDFVPATLDLFSPDPAFSQIQFVPAGGLEHPTRRYLKLSLGFGGHIACAAIELL